MLDFILNIMIYVNYFYYILIDFLFYNNEAILLMQQNSNDFKPKIINYINIGEEIELKNIEKKLKIIYFFDDNNKKHIIIDPIEYINKIMSYFNNIILYNIEIYLILIQKIIYEYQDFFIDFRFGYDEGKVLVNKIILNSITREEMYSNINLDLLLDVQIEPFKKYIYTSRRIYNLLNVLGGQETPSDVIMYVYGGYDRDVKNDIIRNYMKSFLHNPYKLMLKLKTLYKKYERATLLTYGMEYDISVTKSKFLNYNTISNDIVGNKIQDIDIIQYIYKNESKEYMKRVLRYNEEYLEFYEDDLKYFLANTLDNSAIYADDENRETYGVRLKMLLSFTPKKDAYKLQLNNIYGGYTYGWSGHQDAFHIHGEKGSGGYSLYTQYVKKKRTLKQLSRTLGGMYIPQKKYTKLNYGTYITFTKHGKGYNRYGVEVSWETKKKRFYLRNLVGGEFSGRLERGYFRKFLISDDLGREHHIFNTNKLDKGFIRHIGKRTGREANKGLITFQPESNYIYGNFKFNTPKARNKWGKYGIGTLYDYPQVFHNKHLNPQKVYEYVISEIIPYLDVLEKRLNVNSKFVRSYFMRKFYIDSYLEQDEMGLKRKINFNNISCSEFFTTIENAEENINLNFINKNFYGRNAIKNIDFYVGKEMGFSSTELPKSTKVLMKKVYIENLLTSYEKEEKPIRRYIYIKYLSKPKMVMFFNINKSKLFNIIKVTFVDYLFDSKETFKILIEKFGTKALEIRAVENYHKFFKKHNVYKNFVIGVYISFIGLLYSSICMFLILLIRSNMPKNVIYGIARKDKLNGISRLKKQILHEVIINENTSYRDYGLQIKMNQDKIEEKVKEKGEYIILGKKLPLKTNHRAILKIKNTFNMENRYIYRGSIRLGDDNKPLTNKYGIYGKQSKIENSIRENINKELKKTYDIFYKALKFEKNLEKGEDNTKVRLDLDTGVNYFYEQGYLFATMFSGVASIFHRDSNYNHNRKIFGEDSSIDEYGQIVLYYKLSKTITNVLFIFRFFFGIVQTWSIWHGRQRFYQMIHNGVNARLSLRALRKNLENVGSIKWYGDNLDFNINMVYSNGMQIKKQVDEMKNTPSESEKLEKKRIELVSKIVKSVLKKQKQNNMKKFNQFISDIDEKRKLARFDIKLKNLKNKFKVNCGNIAADKAAAEQKIMYEYRHDIEVFKLELEMAEIKLLTAKDNFFTGQRRDWDDKTNSLPVFDNEKGTKSHLLREKKLGATHYERVLREKNFKNNVIDKALDKKDRRFFERIREYNEKLSDAGLAIDLKYKQMEAHESAYVRFNRKLNNNDLDDSYIGYRKYATMGTRFYYILNLVITFFAIGTEHLKKIRKSEFSVGSLILMIKLDFKEYIYITYWEYIVLGERYKAFKKLGYSIMDILKFSLIILMPLVFLGSGLYLILGLFYVLIKIKEKKIIKKIFNILKKVGNIIKKIFNLVNKLNIFLIFFKDIKTGEITINNIYFFFMSFCGFVQRNIYFIKGAFILGYKQKGIVFGLKKVCEYFFYKYKKNKNIIIKKIRNVFKKLINMKLSRKIIIEKIKKLIFKKKESVIIKVDIIKTKGDLGYSGERRHGGGAIKFYKSFLKLFWDIDFKDFVKVYKIFLKDCDDAYIDNGLSKELNKAINELSGKEKVILIIKYLVNLVKIPGRFLLNIGGLRCIKLYKQRGLRPKQYNKYLEATLGGQLHKILKDKAVSKILYNLEYNYSSLLELFILYKTTDERAKTIYQAQYGRWVEGRFTSGKEDIFAKLREPVESLEDYYNNFERGSQYDTGSFGKRAGYSHGYYKKSRQHDEVYIRKQKNLSRDIFFYKKTIIRDRLIRIYFIKGLINGITYVYMKKVVFTEINPLKNEKINKKYKGFKFNYKINDIGEDYHIGTFLRDVPPQFGSLAIIYNIYMQNIYRYFLTDETYPLKGNNNMAFSRDIKGRLGLPNKNVAKMGIMDKYRLATYNLKRDPLDFANHIDEPGYNPMLRGALFLLEFGMTYEDIDEDDVYDENATGGDISMPHLLTYNESLDQLKYEIREYERIIAKTNIFGINKFKPEERKRELYETDRIALLGKMLGKRSKNVANRLKFERSLKNAELLHKALYSYQISTPTESDKEKGEYKNRDLFERMKEQVFQEYDLTRFLEGKATYESKLMEEKYYTTTILSEVKDLQNNQFAEAAKTGKFVTSFDYLLDTLAFASFDQTLSDILDFLKFEIGKIIEKDSKDSEKGIINFKNIHIVVPDILHNINSIEHLKMLEKEDGDTAKIEIKKEKIKKGKEVSAKFYTANKYRPLVGQQGRFNETRKLVDVNILNSYNADSGIPRDIRNITKGEGYKDTYKRSRDYYFYHGTRILYFGAKRINRRSIKFTNIEKTGRKKKKHKINTNSTLVYINHIRGSGTQGLGYDITEIEDDFYDNNLVILNERYRLGFLKRGPIRVKLPVVLKVQEDVFKDYFVNKPKKGMSIFERDAYRVHLFGYALEGQLKDSLNGKSIRLGMEQYYQKDIVNIIFDMAGKGFSKREAKNLNESEKKILAIDAKHMDMFLRNCSVNHQLLYTGFAAYSIDLIRYGDVGFYMDEEFDLQRYFTMKQIEYVVHDPKVDVVIKRVQGIAITKYRPESYAFFYNRVLKGGKLYTLFSIGYYCSIIAILDVLFYKPGIYISNIWVLMFPIIFAAFFRVLRKYLKEESERKRGADVYLYKYQSFEQKTSAELEKELEKRVKAQEASAEFIQRADVPARLIHYDTTPDKVEEDTEDFVPLFNQYEGGRQVSNLNKKNPLHLFRVFKEGVIYMLLYFFFDMGQSESFRIRISEGVGFGYRLDEGLFYSYVPGTRGKGNDHRDINYKRRTGEYDSGTRFEQGGNAYSKGYVNTYNMLQKKDLVELDYGYAAQKVNIELPFYFTRTKKLWVESGFADIYGFSTCETYLLRTRGDDWDLTEYGKLIKPIRGKAPDGNVINNGATKIPRQKVNYFEVEDSFGGLLKADFRGTLREYIIEQVVGPANFRLRGYEPLLKFIKFQKRMQDEYGFYPENIHTLFILEAKKETEHLINVDIARYNYAERALIFKTQKKIQEFYKMRLETYKDVNSIMDIRIRGTITENEKHLHNIFYNFIKYKIKRYELLLESPEYQKIVNKNHDIGFKEIYDELKQKEDILFNKKLEMEIAHNENIVELEKIKKKAEISAIKYEHYINKINKKVSFEEAIEYKSRLLSKLGKEKDGLVIEDLFRNYTGSKYIGEYLLEFVYVLLDFISKI